MDSTCDGPLIPVAEDVYFVEAESRGRYPYAHGLLLTGSETILIDAGLGREVIEQLDREIRVDTLLISHSHPDHIWCWNALADRRLLLPRETPESVTDLQSLGRRFAGSPEKGAHWARVAVEILGLPPLREPDGRYGDGDVLETGKTELVAIHTPGHVEDHYCFLEKNSGTLFTTDIDLTSFGPWYGNPESDIEKFIDSVRSVMSIPYNRVCTSHRAPIEGDATELFERFLGGFDRHRRKVMELCSQPATLEQMVDASPIYRNALDDKIIQRLFEKAMISKHLAILVRDGLVTEDGGMFTATGAA